MVREERQGLSHARNCGMAVAKSPYIAIIDDDETVNEDFVRGYIEFFDAHPNAVAAGGRIVPSYEQGRPSWISPYTERPIANPLDLGEEVRPFGRGRCPGGGNMAVRREAIERYGAFDPSLGRTGKKLIGGEETDFFNRLSRSGAPFYYVPTSIIYHHISPDKLTRDYFTRLSYAIGVSEQIRTRQIGRYGLRLMSEAVKWGATLVLAAGYTLSLRWSAARYLVLMRWQITRGLLHRG
jgi:GT2 family glycosyltransferase